MKYVRRTTGRYLGDRWVLKWFVVPVAFTAAILLGLGLFVMETTPVETAQVVGLFAGFSLAVVALGLVLDRGVRRVTGGSRYDSNRERG